MGHIFEAVERHHNPATMILTTAHLFKDLESQQTWNHEVDPWSMEHSFKAVKGYSGPAVTVRWTFSIRLVCSMLPEQNFTQHGKSCCSILKNNSPATGKIC